MNTQLTSDVTNVSDAKRKISLGASAISRRARKAFKYRMMSWETETGRLLLKQNTENFVSGQTGARLPKQT